jgi:partner of Y14 and mago
VKGSAVSEKNKKRREARKKAKEQEAENAGEDGGKVNGIEGKGKENVKEESKLEVEGVDEEAEKGKKARNLKKKLRQARELKDKKDKGENLLPEQFEKVIKIQELIRQLEGLGFDADGERKKVG